MVWFYSAFWTGFTPPLTDSKRAEFHTFKHKLLQDGVIEDDEGNFKVLAPELIELGASKELAEQGPVH